MTQRDSNLVIAAQEAVTERRKELNDRKLELIKFQGSMAKMMKRDELWKSYSQLCPHEIIELAEIEKEEQIIERLMIRTQKHFEALGEKITIEIRRSDVPDKFYESLKDAPIKKVIEN